MKLHRTYRYRMGRDIRRWGLAALELVFPTRCAGCERLGALLCDDCAAALPRIEQEYACPRCGAPAGRIVCTECSTLYTRVSFAFSQARCAVEFSELTKRLILAYKDGGERRLAFVLAQLLAQAIPLEWRLWADALTWVPADPLALRRRGFDHMEHIARALSAQMGLPAEATLVKRSRADQRKLNRAQRAKNMTAVFSAELPSSVLRTGAPPPIPHSPSSSLAASARYGPSSSPLSAPARPRPSSSPLSAAAEPLRHLILIDDVFTTGATLNAATRTLLSAGIRDVRVATIARVW